MERSLSASSEYFKTLHPSVQKRIKAERAIIRAACKAAIAKGWTVSVYDGEEWCLKRSRSIKAVMGAIMATDEDVLMFRDATGQKMGTAYCVYGNDGWDVIADNSWVESDERNTEAAMNEVMAAAEAVADKWESVL
jgi:hypothetical protein